MQDVVVVFGVAFGMVKIRYAPEILGYFVYAVWNAGPWFEPRT